jgi:hypothetical protein
VSRTSRLLAVLTGVVAVLATVAAPSARADSTISGPVISADKTEVAPGGRVTVTIGGFSAKNVTISVCGNEARRGSADCNMTASVGLRLDDGTAPTITRMTVAAPPNPCPCVLRVSSASNDEVAITPISIAGQATAPLVDNPSLDNLLVASITARPVPHGVIDAIRSDLGGPARYEVTVTIKNRSASPLRQVKVSAAAGRSAVDNMVSIDLIDPGLLGVGQTWKETVIASVPAPSFGTVDWRLTVSGAGPTVEVTSSSRHRPILLIIVLALVVVDIGVLLMRVRIRRRLRRAAPKEAENELDDAEPGSDDESDPAGSPDEPFDVAARVRELVNAAAP